MHLKGRPVCLYAPSNVDEHYNVRTPQEPPDAQLKLEWVYPFVEEKLLLGADCAVVRMQASQSNGHWFDPLLLQSFG